MFTRSSIRIAVIGMGTFGTETARSLMQSGIPVCVIDSEPEIIENLKDQATLAICLDSTDEKALREADIAAMDVVVVAIGAAGIENSIMTTALLKQLGVRRIVARAVSSLHERILRQVGAGMVVDPEREMGARVAKFLARPTLYEVISLPGNVMIAKIPVPEEFIGKTLTGLDVRRKYGVNVLGIERPEKDGTPADDGTAPSADHFGWDHAEDSYRTIMNIDPVREYMKSGDFLLVMGREDNVNRLAE